MKKALLSSLMILCSSFALAVPGNPVAAATAEDAAARQASRGSGLQCIARAAKLERTMLRPGTAIYQYRVPVRCGSRKANATVFVETFDVHSSVGYRARSITWGPWENQ